MYVSSDSKTFLPVFSLPNFYYFYNTNKKCLQNVLKYIVAIQVLNGSILP